MIRTHSRFTFQNTFLNGQIIKPPMGSLDLRRYRVLTQSEARTCRIQHTDCLVRQLPSRDVSMRKTNGGTDRFIKDSNPVMLLKRRYDAAQHDLADVLGRLVYLDDLKAARKR